MRRFQLIRDVDIGGFSGTGIIAEGVLFSTGKAALQWLTKYKSLGLYDDFGQLVNIHGHGGATRVVWLDEEKGPSR